MIKIPGMKTIDLPLTGGVDEISPVNKIAYKDALKMENFRISRDGKRVEKRRGLLQETEYGADGYGVHITTGFGVPVFGYSTYYDANGVFCELAILETGIVRRITGGHWEVIHTWAGDVTIAHPVWPLEIQGKQFIITEKDSRMIHPNGDDYRIGIVAPTSLPTATMTHPAEDTLPLNDLFAYANTAALDAVWTDGDTGNGQSTIVTSGPATQGPDAHDLYLKLTSSAVSTTSAAKRSLTMATSVGSKFTLEINTYFDVVRGKRNDRDFQVKIYSGAFQVPIYFLKGNLCVIDSRGKRRSFGTKLVEDKWINWKFVIDGSDSTSINISAYKDGKYLSKVTYSYPDTTNDDLIELIGNSKISTGLVSVIYIDSVKVTTETPVAAVKTGEYRYAVTYARGGNYGCESNPIKSIVGSATFVGAGLNDMTPGGEYTGAQSKTFRVQIDGTGTPDTIKWSEDNGDTWNSKTIKITGTTYLSYGVTLTFGATTGHTSGNYWYFTCSTCYGTTTNQIVSLSGIPVSGDAQVTQRKLYRTTSGGSRFYWLATINDNTSTTYEDNIPDMALGDELEEDHDTAPNGMFSAWWDGRLWISGDDIIYYSQIEYPEHFDISDRYITVQKGDMSDEITMLVPYKDSLYVFRKQSIYVIQQNTYGYGIFLVTNDVGCMAPWSMVPVNNMLMFLSHRGIELFNGSDIYGVEPSLPLDKAMKTANTLYYNKISGVHFPEKREVWWSFPDRTGSLSAITVVYHYLVNAWYFFSFYKIPSCLVSRYDSSKAVITKMGTRDGYLALCESGYQDHTTNITATYRKPWVESEETADIRRLDVEYEIPVGKILTANIYVDFDKDIQRTDTMVGETISATDIELRRPHFDFSELGQRAKYVSVEFTNAENLGGDLKINEITLYLRDRAIKGKKVGD